jgi:general secretion pathway protein I
MSPKKRPGSAASKRQRGFTLLEAIVAMVLVGTAGMALFDWINVGMAGLNRVREANLRSEAMRNAVAHLDSLNPMLRPAGETDFGAYRVRWDARPLGEAQDALGYPQGIGLHQVALYETDVRIVDPDGRGWFDFRMRQVGYKQIRFPTPGA